VRAIQLRGQLAYELTRRADVVDPPDALASVERSSIDQVAGAVGRCRCRAEHRPSGLLADDLAAFRRLKPRSLAVSGLTRSTNIVRFPLKVRRALARVKRISIKFTSVARPQAGFGAESDTTGFPNPLILQREDELS
jgi:hypothetical protein